MRVAQRIVCGCAHRQQLLVCRSKWNVANSLQRAQKTTSFSSSTSMQKNQDLYNNPSRLFLSTSSSASAAAASSSTTTTTQEPGAANPKSTNTTGGGFIGWWREFKRQMRHELTPLPVPPGYINTSLLDTEKWERVSNEDIRYAIKKAVKVSIDDYKWILLSKKPFFSSSSYPPSATEQQQEGSTTTHTNGGTTTASTSPEEILKSRLKQAEVVAREAGVPTSPEAIRAATLQGASRLIDLAKDEGFRARLASLSADGLRVARECLDQFIIGYMEGKNAEILAYIDEKTKTEKDFLEKVKSIRAQVDAAAAAAAQEQQQQQQQQQQDRSSPSTSGADKS